MQEPVRRAIAYAAALQIAHRTPAAIYSHAEGQHTLMSESYDHGTRSHLSNMRSNTLYLHGGSNHVLFQPSGLNFTGYDHGSGDHFSGFVSGDLVTIYDHGESEHFQYMI